MRDPAFAIRVGRWRNKVKKVLLRLLR